MCWLVGWFFEKWQNRLFRQREHSLETIRIVSYHQLSWWVQNYPPHKLHTLLVSLQRHVFFNLENKFSNFKTREQQFLSSLLWSPFSSRHHRIELWFISLNQLLKKSDLHTVKGSHAVVCKTVARIKSCKFGIDCNHLHFDGRTFSFFSLK